MAENTARSDYAIELKNITKTFGKLVANDNICFSLKNGEIMSLLGENGSGKTTLMNMISGIYYPDSGSIMIKGEKVDIRSPKDAFAHGIGMIHQHFKLVDVLSATENIVLGYREAGKYDMKAAAVKVREICEKYGFDIDPEKKIYDMSVSEKQTVEIIKVLYRGADILILDEPTAVLTIQETEKLFSILKNMKEDGKAIIIITHKLAEVMEISDRVTVLRKGAYIGTVLTSETSPEELTNMMVGAQVSLNIERPEPVDPKPIISVRDLSCSDRMGIQKLEHVSFDIRTGEILGIAGISGCGQKELLEAIAGLQKCEGSILYTKDEGSTEELIGKSASHIRDMGVHLSFVPEDRLGMGLVGNMDMVGNMMLRTEKLGFHFFADRKAPTEMASRIKDDLEVQTPGINRPVRAMSGGNIQKVLVGREIAMRPRVLLSAYAVRGLDINTAYTIYDLLNEQKQAGVAVVYVGEELDVLLQLCDRILVLCDGQVSGVLDGRVATKEQVGMLMTKLGGES